MTTCALKAQLVATKNATKTRTELVLSFIVVVKNGIQRSMAVFLDD
jgi:hypothetical protein